MRAMLLREPKEIGKAPLELVDVPVPEPGPGQVRLRVAACGVCHTDLHTVEGELELPRLPTIPGHQIVGTIDRVGPGTALFAEGNRAGVAWLHRACGTCEFCVKGLENLCPSARFTGLHEHGGYAEYAIAEADFTFPLPARFSDAEAAPLLCAGIIGYRSLRLSEIQPGGRLGLYGFGASAHLAIQIARHWGCRCVRVHPGRRTPPAGPGVGRGWAGGVEEMPPFALDSAVTFAPVGWMVPRALAHLRPGGTLAINAVTMSPIPEMPYATIYGERTVRSVANFTRRDAEEFLRLADEIPVHTEVEVFPLEQANEVLQRLKRSEIRGAAALQIA